MVLRKQISSLYLGVFLALYAINAMADSPKSMSLGGAGRSGLVGEALFLNPALISLQTESSMFAYYTKSRTTEWNSGGKNIALGAYDTTNFLKAGFSYTREQRSRRSAALHTDINKSEFRFGMADQISSGLHLGANGVYTVEKHDGLHTSKFYNGSVGTIANIASDMQLALTYENIAIRNRERPPTAHLGFHYGVWESLLLFADGGMVQKGELKGKKVWSLGTSLPLISSFVLAGGIFHDPVDGYRGKSLGLWWQGPRASFEYALRMSNKSPIQRDHVFGMNILL